jgi:predicted O-linked N-acetylglucosamine transferase (SPINDLY family)
MTAHNATTPVRGWVSNHAEDIESFMFHVGATQDGLTLNFRRIADHFYYLPGDIPATARFIKSLKLDVLIFPDLGNFGKNYQYAGMRLAPVQCTTWGQPVTSGLSTIDYYLSSELMEPENADEHYTEKLVRLPGSGWHWMPRVVVPNQKSARELGVPEGPFYFIAQYVNKLTPKWDFLFRDLQEATGAEMVFVEFGTPFAVKQTRERLEAAGVRATWIPVQEGEDLSRIFQLCTASLDPPSWHGGSTTVQALMAGGAIVSMPGPFMRSRFSLALLKQANVEGLIAPTPEAYVRLAADPDRIREVMKGLNPEGPVRDPAVPPALDAFLRRVSGR